MAERALRGVGDAQLGEWRETGRNGVMHVRRRLTDRERVIARHRPGTARLEVRDIRGTDEERQRLRRLVKDAPELAHILSLTLPSPSAEAEPTPGPTSHPQHRATPPPPSKA